MRPSASREIPATHVFILLDGWVKVISVTADGRESILALRGTGDLVGETAGETTGAGMPRCRR